ncbi:uncharacterized protein LOC106459319 isoform X3 [Limulus polyphemus]|uniref:Uncharacterized protein LOC106459319 isoform X3 n=1 Tax=Limulus polyphemus TaxID=6850 RepID=A0ABM1SCX8_LIMPO|nr:uncharacterized protein LOC106459319 isoform X3 [Limulus polyphemus]
MADNSFLSCSIGSQLPTNLLVLKPTIVRRRLLKLNPVTKPGTQENKDKVEEPLKTVNGGPAETNVHSTPEEKTEEVVDSVDMPVPRENGSPNEMMYKTSTTLDINEDVETANDVTSLSTTSSSTGSCATTIVANTDCQESQRWDEAQSTRNSSSPQIPKKAENGTKEGENQEEHSISSNRYSPINVTITSTSRKVWTPGQPISCASSETKSQELRREDEKSKFKDVSTVRQSIGNGPDENTHFKNMKMNTDGVIVENDENKKHPNGHCQCHGYDTWKISNAPSDPSILSSTGVSSNRSQHKSVLNNIQSKETKRGQSSSSVLQPSMKASSHSQVEGVCRLPVTQNPIVIIMQKAREGQLPKGPSYIDSKPDHLKEKSPRNKYYINTVSDLNLMGEKIPSKYYSSWLQDKGIPDGLQLDRKLNYWEVQDQYNSDWYRSMYRSLHRLEQLEGKVSHAGGYVSEPEYDRKDYTRGSKCTIYGHRSKQDRDRGPKELLQEKRNFQLSQFQPSQRTCEEVYKNQPYSIAEYEPGKSSIAQKQAKLEEVYNEKQKQRSLLQQDHCPKQPYIFSDGYESDSMLIKKTGKTDMVDPEQQKAWYREIQRGGEIPFTGLRKRAPEKPKEPLIGPPPPTPRLDEADILTAYYPSYTREPASPHQYQESVVNIHYRSPVRNLEKDYIDEEELRHKQEDAMRKFYEEEKYKKELQQLEEMEKRRHSDNFIPSQKSPIALNRYEDPFGSPTTPLPKTSEPRDVARVLYNFTAHSAKELSVKKGDIVYITKNIDKNWFLGEHHGMVGILPFSYVELIPQEAVNLQPKKTKTEGKGLAKYNFLVQTPLELPLYKGQELALIQRVDQNWYEGRIGNNRGIVPVSYIEVLKEPDNSARSVSPKAPLDPIFSGKEPSFTRSPQAWDHLQTPNSHNSVSKPRDKHQVRRTYEDEKEPITQSLHIDTYNGLIPYRVLYSHRPQNNDELELLEGDIVYVMEKCNDGWYVGTSTRTGILGTFPGNYVVRI